MILLKWLGLANKQSSPPKVATDEIIPAFEFDDTSGTAATAKLEIHIPQRFTSDRPALGYSHETFDCAIGEHSLASRLPKATPRQASVHAGPDEFGHLARSEKTPSTIDDYLFSDVPQLWLHVVSFVNATLVSITWCHVTTDATGMSALMRAWSAVLAGREDGVPPMRSFRDDPVATVKKADDGPQYEKPYLADRQVSGIWAVFFILRVMLDMLLYRNPQNKSIFIPKAVVQQLKEQAIREAGADTAARTSDSAEDVILHSQTGAPLITDGDLLTAWMSRIIVQCLPPNSTRTILIVNVLDIRERATSLFAGQGDGVNIQNLTAAGFTLIPAQKVIPGGNQDVGVGPIASAVRWTIAKQSTDAQICAAFRLHKQTGQGPLYGDPSNFFMLFTNWSKAKFVDALDFAPAVVGGAGKMSGRPVYYHALLTKPPVQAMWNSASIHVQPSGDVWMTAYLPAATWKRVELGVEALAKPTSE